MGVTTGRALMEKAFQKDSEFSDNSVIPEHEFAAPHNNDSLINEIAAIIPELNGGINPLENIHNMVSFGPSTLQEIHQTPLSRNENVDINLDTLFDAPTVTPADDYSGDELHRRRKLFDNVIRRTSIWIE